MARRKTFESTSAIKESFDVWLRVDRLLPILDEVKHMFKKNLIIRLTLQLKKGLSLLFSDGFDRGWRTLMFWWWKIIHCFFQIQIIQIMWEVGGLE